MSLKTKRKSKGYSQEEVSIKLGIPLRTYKRYELSEENKHSYKHDLIESQIDKLPKNKVRKNINKETICIIGAGNVGYPLGLLLSEKNKVVFIDNDLEKVRKINNGECLIEEEDAINFFNKYKPKLKAYSDNKYIAYCDSIIICLPTLFNESSNQLDTKKIKEYLSYINENNPKATIVIKSTVPIGFTEELAKQYNKLEIIFAPEFLREERSLFDSANPSRIIFGVKRVNLKNKRMAIIFENITLNASKTLFTNYKEAEAIKLFSNSFLAMRVAYFNEVDSFSLKNKLNSETIINGMCLDPRIGNFYNNPSFGFGGHCFPKDTKQLASTLPDSELICSLGKSNLERANVIADEIINKVKGTNSIIGFYNVYSKNSSSLTVLDIVKNKGFNTLIYNSKENSQKEFESFIKNADIIVANRMDKQIYDYREKVFSRDLFDY